MADDDFYLELQRAADLPYGAARTAVLERAVTLADAGLDPGQSVTARLWLTNAYQHGNEPEKAFATFGWTLAQWRERPELFSDQEANSLRWAFKYMVASAIRFPVIGLDRIEQILADMESEYRSSGGGMQPVHHYRHRLAWHVGDLDKAEREFERWVTSPRTSLSDCEVCDPDAMAAWHASNGRHAEAVDIAAAALAGSPDCISQPQDVQSTLMLSLAALGRFDDARYAHLASYRKIRDNRNDLSNVAEHLEFCALSHNEARGLEILERHYPWLATPRDPSALLDFYEAGVVLLQRLDELGHSALEIAVPDGTRTADELRRDWMTRAYDLAASFDARNGTTYQTEMLRESLAREPLTTNVSLVSVTATVLAPPPSSEESRTVEPDVDVERYGESFLPPPVDLATRWEQRWRLDLPAERELAEEVAASGDPDHDAPVAWASGVQAFRAGDLTAAGRHMTTASELYGPDSASGAACALWASIASSRSATATDAGDNGIAVDAVEAVDAVIRRADEAATDPAVTPAERVDLVRGVAGCLHSTGRVDEALRRITAALDGADIDDPLLRAALLTNVAGINANAGRYAEALEAAEQAARLRDSTPHAARSSRTLAGRLRASLGDLEGAVEALRLAVSLPGDLRYEEDHPRPILGMCLLDLGQTDEGILALSEAVAELRAAGQSRASASAALPLGRALLREGRAVEAAEVLESALPAYGDNAPDAADDGAATDSGDDAAKRRARIAGLLAEALAGLDMVDDSFRRADEAVPGLLEAGDWQSANEVQAAVGQAARRDGRWADATRLFEAATTRARSHGEAESAAHLAVITADCRIRSRYAEAEADTEIDIDAGIDAAAAAADEVIAELDDPARTWWRAELAWTRAMAGWNMAVDAHAIQPHAAAAEAGFAAVDDIRAAGVAAMLQGELQGELDRASASGWSAARAHLERAHDAFVRVQDEALRQRAASLLRDLDPAAGGQ